jgi:hypothetical protein
MNNARRYRRLGALSALLLLSCGCELPFLHSPEPAPKAPDAVSHWQDSPVPGKQGPPPGEPPGVLFGKGMPPPRNEQIALMSEQLRNADQDRSVLAERLRLVEGQLSDKEKALAAATQEIQEATGQIVKTRNELQQWKKDMTTLRDRVGLMEKDNRETLETIIKTLEQILDREKEGKASDLAAPVLPMPKH